MEITLRVAYVQSSSSFITALITEFIYFNQLPLNENLTSHALLPAFDCEKEHFLSQFSWNYLITFKCAYIPDVFIPQRILIIQAAVSHIRMRKILTKIWGYKRRH